MRKYLIALVAVVAVLVTVAFTPDITKKDKKAVLTTYYYTSDDSYSQHTNETLYIKNPVLLVKWKIKAGVAFL